ncbi:hypothetical protein GOODEAATRI_027731, partial [Goodea atripinnis]
SASITPRYDFCFSSTLQLSSGRGERQLSSCRRLLEGLTHFQVPPTPQFVAELLQCCECSASLSHWYYEKDGRLYCKKDYWAKFGELCHGCNDPITTGLIMVRADSSLSVPSPLLALCLLINLELHRTPHIFVGIGIVCQHMWMHARPVTEPDRICYQIVFRTTAESKGWDRRVDRVDN